MRKKPVTVSFESIPCDIWTQASRSSTGQALHVYIKDKKRYTKLAARIFWEIAYMVTLSPKDVVVNVCGEPMCVLVAHMRLKTRKEVALERTKKKFLPDCPASVAKLPLEKRVMLTMCVASDIGTNARLARRFGVTPYQVRTIREFVRQERIANERAAKQLKAEQEAKKKK